MDLGGKGAVVLKRGSDMSGQDAKLLIHLKQLEHNPVGYRALHCHVAALSNNLKTRDNLTQTMAILRGISHNGLYVNIFLLKNLDVVYVARDVEAGTLRGAAAKIHRLFGAPPLARANAYGGQEFYRLFEIGENDAPLRRYAETIAAPEAAFANENTNGKTMDGTVLARIRDRLPTADISSMILSQSVYAMDGARQMVPVFREIYVSIKALEEAFCPGVSLTGRKGLFNELTEDLDAAVLSMLARNPDLHARRFSLNLNLSAVESKTFNAFDATLKPEHRGNVVIEIHRNDLVANFTQYRRLAPILVERGYSICIDGLDAAFLPHLDLKGLHCRFAKMFWSEDLLTEARELKGELDNRARDGEGVTYIMAHCDKPDAIKIARTIGVDLIQGKMVDHMVRNNIPV